MTPRRRPLSNTGLRGLAVATLLTLTAGTSAACGSGSAASTTTGQGTTSTTSAAPTQAPAGTWTKLPASPLPVLLVATGVWTGSELVIVGETSGETAPPAALAAAYDPARRVWRTLPSPGKRTGVAEGTPVSVWTGTEMIVWGGSFQEAYNPGTNRWRTLPTREELPHGGDFTVAWTGTEMLLHGGGAGGETNPRGASYRPATNTWTMLPASPLAGRYSGGAWTGTELLIAGGTGDLPNGDVTDYADGAAYRPADRSWRPVPALPAAGEADLVWNGSEVIALGATVAARHTPGATQWRPLAEGFDQRERAAVVWAGDRVLLWGGQIGVGLGANRPTRGLSYDPVRDAWTSLSSAPMAARAYPIGVWTGQQFLVWGGTEARDGAAFTP